MAVPTVLSNVISSGQLRPWAKAAYDGLDTVDFVAGRDALLNLECDVSTLLMECALGIDDNTVCAPYDVVIQFGPSRDGAYEHPRLQPLTEQHSGRPGPFTPLAPITTSAPSTAAWAESTPTTSMPSARERVDEGIAVLDGRTEDLALGDIEELGVRG